MKYDVMKIFFNLILNVWFLISDKMIHILSYLIFHGALFPVLYTTILFNVLLAHLWWAYFILAIVSFMFHVMFSLNPNRTDFFKFML